MTQPLKVGDLLMSSWGYDQTNVDFYQVVALNGKTQVTIRKIASDVHVSPFNDMVGTCMPIKDKFVGEARRVKPNEKGVVMLTSYSAAWPCRDDEVARWSSYA